MNRCGKSPPQRRLLRGLSSIVPAYFTGWVCGPWDGRQCMTKSGQPMDCGEPYGGGVRCNVDCGTVAHVRRWNIWTRMSGRSSATSGDTTAAGTLESEGLRSKAEVMAETQSPGASPIKATSLPSTAPPRPAQSGVSWRRNGGRSSRDRLVGTPERRSACAGRGKGLWGSSKRRRQT